MLRRWLGRSVAEVANTLMELASTSYELAQATKAQADLDANLSALREALAARGEPARIGDRLYFGDKLINDDVEIVDHVRREHGGAATIFLGDQRISTNIAGDDGRRAVGTRLAHGAAFEKLFSQSGTYHGQTKVLGEDYIALYEPIFIGSAVAGAIFVGVPAHGVVSRRKSVPRLRSEVARMRVALETVTASIEGAPGGRNGKRSIEDIAPGTPRAAPRMRRSWLRGSKS